MSEMDAKRRWRWRCDDVKRSEKDEDERMRMWMWIRRLTTVSYCALSSAIRLSSGTGTRHMKQRDQIMPQRNRHSLNRMYGYMATVVTGI
jgi:hypothetical protein